VNVSLLCDEFRIGGRIRDAALRARERIAGVRYDAQEQVAAKVLRAFADERIDENDLWGSTGYGYGDSARARYESLLSRLFGVERTFARLSLVSGTQAIVTAIAACVPPGKTLLSITGPPYDTLRNAIVQAPHSLVEAGVRYREVGLAGGRIDVEGVARVIKEDAPAAVFVQRSRGYAPRPSISIAECADAFTAVRRAAPQCVILVDDCYGELVEPREPTHVGADLAMGSLIKNLGGGLAPGGGYVCGRADLVERVAARHVAPGVGSGVGPSLGFGRAFVQGLFHAPLAIEQTLRGLDFAAALFAELGFDVDPAPGAPRTDIVQAIRLGEPDLLLRFAAGLQSAMPLNARFRPEPGTVPGYAEPVVMSSGAFVAGATIELSCDAPMRPPYEVYLQGGLSAAHVAVGALLAAGAVCRAGAAAVGEKQASMPSDKVSRRQFRRATVDFPMTVIVPGGELVLTGSALDLSAGGMRVATATDLPAGQSIVMRFVIPKSDREALVLGRVVLSYFDAATKRYTHGIAFTRIAPEDQEHIAKLVESSPEVPEL
jgi:cystathionine beta-lyase family protein involved in aluminum resistance